MAERIKELKRRCLNLTEAQRKRLIIFLQNSMKEKKNGRSRFSILLPIAEDIAGKGILSKSRNLNLVVGRRMIAYQMMKEGYSPGFIGKCLFRHRTSVLHMLKMWDEAMYFEFNLELSYWEQFQKKLKEIDNAN